MVNDVTDLGHSILINIKNTKNKIERNFIVKNSDRNTVNFTELCRKYMGLRKAETLHSRFFVRYQNNQCTMQPVGKNIFGILPQKVAAFLNLPDSSLYTGHCFRRTSASLLADSGASVDVLKRHGGWKSAAVAEGYVENSINNKKTIADKIFGHGDMEASQIPGPSGNTSRQAFSLVSEAVTCTSTSNSVVQHTVDETNRLFNIVNCANVNINVNINK